VDEKSKSSRAAGGGGAGTQPRGIEQIIKAAIDRGASDLHIKAGDVFRARIDGKLLPLTKQRLTPEQTRAIAQHLVPNEEDRARLERLRDYDCSWGMPGVGRFRVNILRQRSSFMIVLRVIPFDIPTFDTLHLPAILATIAAAERGMILVTGVTGSGKSSTMAAIVNQINQTQHKHVITLENPIEFLHRDINSSVTQREIGVDTDDFGAGLRAALRQDPDVLLIGELRDAETIATAMKAAETGHLVISTLDTPDAVTTVNRVVTMFPAEAQEVARLRLAETLQAVVSQRLLPRLDGQGRVAVVEILICTGTVREMIKDPDRTSQLPDYIRIARDQYGTQTFDQHLLDLVADGTVAYETARTVATHPADFELQMRTLRRRPPAASPAPQGTPPPSSPSPVTPASAADRPAGVTDDLSSLLPGQ
jgi:twitching motility protein PilT